MQQRGIPLEVVECLMDFGAVEHDNHGAEILFFDQATRRRILDIAD